MSPQSDLLQAGIAAIKQHRYAQAIQALEAFCRMAGSEPKDFFQAQMWLARAYYEGGQPDRAIALCQRLSASGPPQVKAWADKLLPTLINPPSPDTPPAAPVEPSPQPATAPTAPGVARSPLTDTEAAQYLSEGNKALKMNKFEEAIQALERYCGGVDPAAKDYAQAQMWLAKAYKGNGQNEAAIALCQTLVNHEKPFVQIWAKQFLTALGVNAPAAGGDSAEPAAEESSPQTPGTAPDTSAPRRRRNSPATAAPDTKGLPKAGRAARGGVKLTMRGVAASLSMASSVTLSLLVGMVLMLTVSLLMIQGNVDPLVGLIAGVAISILFNLLVFFIAPIILDIIQQWMYDTRWTSLSEIERYSPEAGRIVRLICQQKKIQHPRFGLIEDDNPTAFTYGSIPNSARLVLSRGIFTYLDDDEIATVVAHEMGHIVHWDFAVMTLADTLVQITYLLYVYIREIADHFGDGELGRKVKGSAQMIAIAAYIFYQVGEFLLLYLSRTREYYADHFAAEITGNPNALSRALVKIAYGILEEGKRTEKPSKVLQGTRALGIADPNSAPFTGSAYRIASDPAAVGRVFLWDMFNPWAWWMELTSTHPLTGKRIRALTTYAEQLGLDSEFDMSRVIREGRSLNKKRLYGNFVLDVLLYWADWIGLLLGAAIGTTILVSGTANWTAIVPLVLIGFGIGTLMKTFVMYPDFNRAPNMDVLTLMSDPYASPLRGRPVKLAGEVIGRGDSGSKFGSDLQMQDSTGMIFLRYSSRFGPLGNFLFGLAQAQSFVHRQVSVVGWFRRGMGPWIDLVRMDCPEKWTVMSYHRFWSILLGGGAILLGFVLPSIL